MLLSRAVLTLSIASSGLAANSWIAPGTVWYDTAGKKIDAHGGGIVKRGSTFYWIGQSASNSETPMMYQSTDLLNWENLGAQASITGLWRPKIAKPNGSFWAWQEQIYGQQDRYVDSLVSTTQVGGYTQHAKVYLPPDSYSYSDTGMFYDDATTSWYLLTSADHNVVQINLINSDGSIGNRVSYLAAGAYEAPGMFKAGGVYFLIVSGKTGWRANPNKVFTATSINGPWSGGSDVAPEDQNTYGSQNTFELTIAGSKATTYIYMGDAWDSKGGPDSNYVWLPMSVSTSAKTVTLQYHAMWKVDPNTGVVTYPSTRKRYDTSHARITGHANVAECQKCLHKRSILNIDTSSQVIFHNVTGTGEPQWLSFHYTVNDPTAGQAYILINDDAIATNMSDHNSRAGYAKVVPVRLTLKHGDVNTITFGASGSADFEASLEGIELHDD